VIIESNRRRLYRIVQASAGATAALVNPTLRLLTLAVRARMIAR